MKQATIKRILEILDDYAIDVNYGLAPNPFGFTFIDQDTDTPDHVLKELSELLSSLNDGQITLLRKELYG